MISSAPAEDGLFMPAEWSPHERCWMAWPSRLALWGEHYEEACRAYAAVARAIAAFEPVTMLVPPEHALAARLQLGPKVTLQEAALDDSWTRDAGPLFLTDGQDGVAGVAWRFNGWGNKYHPYDKDAALAGWLLRQLGMHAYEGPMVLEGGAVHVDGMGTVLTTEECLLNDNRNPTLDRRQVEERLGRYLGARRILWLPRGLVGDETDGHIDNVARFVAPTQVMCSLTEDRGHPDYDVLQEAHELLRAARDAFGRPLEVLSLPHPAPREEHGRRLAASYVNFYIANGAIILPAYEDRADADARAAVAEAFPEREIVQLPALAIARGGGAIHCITQQQPAGAPLR